MAIGPKNTQDHGWLAFDNLGDCIGNIAQYLQLAPTPGSLASGTRTARVTATSAIVATETLIINAPLVLPGSSEALSNPSVNAGTDFSIYLAGTCTSSNADTATFTFRMGTVGTVAGDASVATVAFTTDGAGTAIPFSVHIFGTFRTPGTGTNGTLEGAAVVNDGLAGTGFIAGASDVKLFSSTTVPNTATFFDLSLTTAATSATTIQVAEMIILP